MVFFRRQAVIPFETALAAICAYSGIAGFLRYGIINTIFTQVLGVSIANGFNATYLASGVAIFLGIGMGLRNLEAFGVIILIMSLLIRTIVVHHHAGFSPDVVNSYVFSLFYSIAGAVRLWSLIKRQVLVETTVEVLSRDAS